MSQTWRTEGSKLHGPVETRPTRRNTPRAALATAEFRLRDGEAPEIAFRLAEQPDDVHGWCVEVRRGCAVCATYEVSGFEGCFVYAEICACCLPCDVYSVVLMDDKCDDCATVYLDLMKAEGYGQAAEVCTCGGHYE